MKNVSETLKSIGMLDSETETYLAALEHGPQTVIDLSKNTELSRQAVYTAIDTLTDRGLMSYVQQGKKKLFAAEPPSKLLAYAKRKDREMHDKVKDLEASLPELELRAGGERPSVHLYEGKEGLMTLVHKDTKDIGTEIFEITDLDAMYSCLTPKDLKNLRDKTRGKRTKVHGMYSGTPKPTKVTVDRYMLPQQFQGFNSHIAVNKNRVEMATFSGKMSTIVIESAQLAAALRIVMMLAIKQLNRQ